MNLKDITISLSLIITLLSTSCSNSTEAKQESKKQETKEQKISYSKSNTKLTWSAYKTTDKLAVNGTFKNIIVSTKETKDIEHFINSTSFKIVTASVFTKNIPRDILIKDFFFGAMMNTDTISGSFSEAKNGEGFVTLKMNNTSYKNKFTYKSVNDTIKINTSILLDNFNGDKALKSLNEQCFDKHKGADGISKTWKDVDVEIISIINRIN